MQIQSSLKTLLFLFQIPSREVDKGEDKFWTEWNPDTKQFFLQFHFKQEDSFNPQPAR